MFRQRSDDIANYLEEVMAHSRLVFDVCFSLKLKGFNKFNDHIGKGRPLNPPTKNSVQQKIWKRKDLLK